MLEASWIPVTLGAAFAQTLRNAPQRGLTTGIGVVAGTRVRFLFGPPFALVFLAAATTLAGRIPPLPDAAAAAWIAPGAIMQMIATALMLAAMRLRSFVVAIAGVAITTWPRTGLVLDLG